MQNFVDIFNRAYDNTIANVGDDPTTLGLCAVFSAMLVEYDDALLGNAMRNALRKHRNDAEQKKTLTPR